MDVKNHLEFTLNGKKYKVPSSALTPDLTLNTYIRNELHLTGTKKMCLEGGCGACMIVAMRKLSNETTVQALNSCLIPLMCCNGWEILTIEGLSTISPEGDLTYHPLQKVLTDFNGSQCGFCSPGMIMNMYAVSKSSGKLSRQQVENSFGGNICRCTGYRSILTAFKSVCDDLDIEDLKPCHKQFDNENGKKASYCFKMKNQHCIIKVFKLEELLQIMETFKETPYKLIAGNTSEGVYKDTNRYDVLVDVSSVEELTSHKVHDNCFQIGANLTLTHAIKLFKDTADTYPGFHYLTKLSRHIELIANESVRNLGTLAGNLMIKYNHHDFHSDLFVILEAVGAELILANSLETFKISVKNLINISLEGSVIVKIVLPSRSEGFQFNSYKIMPRSQNTFSLVNAAFMLQISAHGILKSASIVYGCITPEFVHATETEDFLVGRNIFSNDVLQECLKLLKTELNSSGEYQQNLAISLFYKFILSIAPSELLSDRVKSGGLEILRPISEGLQDFETNQSMYPITKGISKIESMAQTSGRAEYIADMPDLPNQLFGGLVLARVPALSTVKNINVENILKIEGVVAFFDKRDIQGQNTFMPKEMNFPVQEEIFCNGKVLYYNQVVGLVVAKSQENAEKAAKLIENNEISYLEPSEKSVLTIQDVLQSSVPKINLVTHKKSTDDIGEIASVVKGTFELSWQYHFHLENQCCNIVPTEDGLDVYPSSQWLDLSQNAIATTLNMPANKINIFIRRLGGGFGAKISRNSLISCAASIAAYKLRRPVKIWLPLETNMDVFGKRYPVLSNYEVSLNSAGEISHLNNTFYSDYGIGGNEPNISYVLDTFLSTYKTDNWEVKAHSVNTNNHASCWIRAPGTCEGLAMVESIMEHLAMTLKVDPLEFRLKHLDRTRNPKLVGFIKDMNEWAQIETRNIVIQQFNRDNKWRKKGLSVVPMTYPFHLFGNYGVIVSIYHIDGSVSVAHGGVEMGQGINTKVAQVCAYKFGISIENVTVKPSNNLVGPNGQMTGGSLTTESVCFGVIKACDELLKRIEPFRDSVSSWSELIEKCYSEFINLSAHSMSTPKEKSLENYSVHGVCCTEIELDVLTGQHVITRVDLIEDAGSSINPSLDIGQVEGAFVMGIGYFTTETITFNQEGRLLTNRTWNYKPPGAKDIPANFRVKFPKNNPNTVGVLHSKAISEPPICLSVSVPLAIRNAVASFRAECEHEAWYPFCGPSTVENTFMNCNHDVKNYTL